MKHKPASPINRRNLGYVIALSALLISIPRYVATFSGIDPVKVTAYGMGVLLAGGAAYIVDAWADATRRKIKRTNLLLLVLGINLAYEPVLLTPFVLSRLWSEPLASVMSNGYAVFWSVMVTLAPVLLVFGVVYAVWFHRQPAQTEQTTDASEQVSVVQNKAEQAPKQKLPFVCAVCGDDFATKKALSGHGNKHRANGNGHLRESQTVTTYDNWKGGAHE